MEYKNVYVTESVSVPVPIGMTADEEANYIANRIGFANLEELEATCRQAMKDLDDGKLVDLRVVLEELQRDPTSTSGQEP